MAIQCPPAPLRIYAKRARTSISSSFSAHTRGPDVKFCRAMATSIHLPLPRPDAFALCCCSSLLNRILGRPRLNQRAGRRRLKAPPSTSFCHSWRTSRASALRQSTPRKTASSRWSGIYGVNGTRNDPSPRPSFRVSDFGPTLFSLPSFGTSVDVYKQTCAMFPITTCSESSWVCMREVVLA